MLLSLSCTLTEGRKKKEKKVWMSAQEAERRGVWFQLLVRPAPWLSTPTLKRVQTRPACVCSRFQASSLDDIPSKNFSSGSKQMQILYSDNIELRIHNIVSANIRTSGICLCPNIPFPSLTLKHVFWVCLVIFHRYKGKKNRELASTWVSFATQHNIGQDT